MLVYYYPATDLEIARTQVQDETTGDGDARLDPGESSQIAVRIFNGLLAEERTGINLHLECADPLITIASSTATAPDLGPGDSAWAEPPFSVTVSRFAEIGKRVTLHLSIDADGGYANTDSFTLTIGDCPVLL
ncbi:MAG: hypothetical protein DRN14_04970, partial [Thermoplasmata archaeon]